MNDDFISREAAIKEVYRFDGYLDDDMEWRLHYALKKLPAADVVKIVRCKDCEYWMPDGENVMVCTGPMAYSKTDETWYCASAKRR